MTRSSQQAYIQRLGFQDKDRANPRHGLACEYLLEKIINRDFVSQINLEAKAALNWLRKRVKENIEKIEPDLQRHQRVITGDSEYAFCDKDWHVKSIKELTPILEELRQKEQYLEKIESIGGFSLQELLNLFYSSISYSNYINVPVRSGKFVNGFADVLIQSELRVGCDFAHKENLELAWTANLIRNADYYYAKSRPFLGEVKITPEPAENIIQQIAFYRTFVSVDEVIVLVDYDAPQLKRMTQGSDIKVYRLGPALDKWCAERPQPELEEF